MRRELNRTKKSDGSDNIDLSAVNSKSSRRNKPTTGHFRHSKRRRSDITTRYDFGGTNAGTPSVRRVRKARTLRRRGRKGGLWVG